MAGFDFDGDMTGMTPEFLPQSDGTLTLVFEGQGQRVELYNLTPDTVRELLLRLYQVAPVALLAALTHILNAGQKPEEQAA